MLVALHRDEAAHLPLLDVLLQMLKSLNDTETDSILSPVLDAFSSQSSVEARVCSCIFCVNA